MIDVTKLLWISDPSHAWLKVPLDVLWTLQSGHVYSDYSYRTEEFAYLEEDCDATLFLRQNLISQHDAEKIPENHCKYCDIRTYKKLNE